MNNRTWIALVTMVLFVSLAAAAAQAAPAAEREGLLGAGAKNVQTKNLTAGPVPAAGKTLRIDRTQAQMTISAWDKNEISAEATVEVGDSDPELIKEFLDNTTMKLEAEGGGFVLRLMSPMDWERGHTTIYKKIGQAVRSGRWNLSYAARIVVRVPASQSLDVSNSFGDIAVNGVTGRLKLRNESGQVRVEGGGGELALETSFADVRVANFKGAIDVRNESGAVSAENIGGRADIHTSFKDVRFAKIGGPLTVTAESAGVTGSDVAGDCRITSSFQKIEVRGIRGRLEVNGESAPVTVRDVDLDAVVGSSFGDIAVTGVGGSLEVRSESAKVTAADVKKDVAIRTSFKDVEARRIGGGLTVEAESSGVLAEDIGGAVSVRSSFSRVVLRRTSGSITVTAESAPVEIAEIKALPSGSVIDVKTSFGPIRITLPAGAEFQGTAKAGFGKVITDIPVTLTDSGSFEGQVVSFGTGKGGVTLRLETTADITIKKQ